MAQVSPAAEGHPHHPGPPPALDLAMNSGGNSSAQLATDFMAPPPPLGSINSNSFPMPPSFSPATATATATAPSPNAEAAATATTDGTAQESDDEDDDAPLPDGCFQFSCFNVKHWEARHSDPDWQLLLECVGEKHREKVKKFYNFLDAKRSLVGHLACRIILAKLLQQQYEKMAKLERRSHEQQRQREHWLQQQAASKVASKIDAAVPNHLASPAPMEQQQQQQQPNSAVQTPTTPSHDHHTHHTDEPSNEVPPPLPIPHETSSSSSSPPPPTAAATPPPANTSSGRTSPRRPTLAARLREHSLLPPPPPSLSNLVGEIGKKPLLPRPSRPPSCIPPLKFRPLRGKSRDRPRPEIEDSDTESDDEPNPSETGPAAAHHSADATTSPTSPTRTGPQSTTAAAMPAKGEPERAEPVPEPQPQQPRERVAQLAKTSLSQFLARVQFALTKENKPYLPKLGAFHSLRGLNFNISHSGDWVLLGITSHVLVGVDVEEIKYPARTNCNAFLDNMRECFTRHEWNEIIKVNPRRQFRTREDELFLLERFFIHWVLKESFIKAIGKGILFGMHRAEFRFKDTRPHESMSFVPGNRADNSQGIHIFSHVMNENESSSSTAATSGNSSHGTTVRNCELYDKMPVLWIDGKPREGWRFVVKKMDQLHVAAVALGPLTDSEISTSFRSTLHMESDNDGSSSDEEKQPPPPQQPQLRTVVAPSLAATAPVSSPDLSSVTSALGSVSSMDVSLHSSPRSSISDISGMLTEEEDEEERTTTNKTMNMTMSAMNSPAEASASAASQSTMRRAQSTLELSSHSAAAAAMSDSQRYHPQSHHHHHHRRSSEEVTRNLFNRPIVFEHINAEIFRELLTEASSPKPGSTTATTTAQQK